MMLWTCKQCGLQASNIEPGIVITCRCGYVDRRKEETQSCIVDNTIVPPRVLRKGLNYMHAWVKWVKAGRPTRDDDAVDKLRIICSGCEYFDGKICKHKRCGCTVSKAGFFGDKLRWATESCPIGKW